MNLSIISTASYLPELQVTNDDLSQVVETSDEWIRTRTGIRSRHYANGENCWELGTKAAQQAMAKAHFSPDDIDGVIFTTCTPDYYTPSMASLVCRELGIHKAFNFDVNVACSGFIYALDMAARYLQDPSIRNILVVSAEAMSHFLDFTDRSSFILFGDGAGACIVTQGEGKLLASVLKSQPQSAEAISAPALTQVTHPFGQDQRTARRTLTNEREKLYMNGSEVYRYAVQELIDLVNEVTAKAAVPISAIDLFVPHQANQRIIHAAAKHSAIPEEKVVVMLEDTGNLSSASIPYCLNRLSEEGKLVPGMLLLLCGFGSGLTSGAVLLEWA